MITLLLVFGLAVIVASFAFAGLLECFRHLSTQSERRALSWYGKATYYVLGFILGPAVEWLLNKTQTELRVFISVILAFATLLTIAFTGDVVGSASIFVILMLIVWLSLPTSKSTQ
jgi:hypothetical protein